MKAYLIQSYIGNEWRTVGVKINLENAKALATDIELQYRERTRIEEIDTDDMDSDENGIDNWIVQFDPDGTFLTDDSREVCLFQDRKNHDWYILEIPEEAK